MKEITLEIKIADLLNNYPNMKETLIAINPKFKKLNNPVLRRTLAKVASVKQAAIVGGMEPIDLVNRLRESIGQEPIKTKDSQESHQEDILPSWVSKNEPRGVMNANILLDEEKNPLAEAKKLLKELNSDEMIAIESDFKPEPLIEEFEKGGYRVYCKKINDNHYMTYIKKEK